MKLLFSILSTFVVVASFGQNAPDWEIVYGEVTNPSSEYYYPRLMERYQKNDTTLNQQQYHYLYYGFTFQDDYKPLLRTNYADSLSMVFSNRRVATGDEFSKIERYCKAILTVEPFNMRDINALAFAYENIGYLGKAAEQMCKLQMIANVIKSTGDGLDESSPWYITYPDHMDDLLNLMDLDPGRHIKTSNTVEFVTCKKTTDKRIKGYYFDYEQIYKRTDYLKDADKPRRKLDINPTPAIK